MPTASPALEQYPTLPTLPSPVVGFAAAMHEIKSAGSSVLTSAGLAAFKQSLASAHEQSAAVERNIAETKPVADEDARRYRWWADGWLFRNLRKARFVELQAKTEESSAMLAELNEQLELSRLSTDFQMPDGIAKAYSRLSDDFVTCSHSQRIWDNVAQRAANRVAERTVAGRIVDLKPVRFSTGQCGVIRAPMDVPCLQNANGGDMYLYPGFLVYHASATNYALIEFSDVDLQVVRTQFHEEGAAPTDAVRVGTTWAKANKDGSPDKRFKGNYQIPVMQYARLTLTSAAGLNEEYMLSNVAAAEAFAVAWRDFRRAQASGS